MRWHVYRNECAPKPLATVEADSEDAALQSVRETGRQIDRSAYALPVPEPTNEGTHP